MTTDTLINAARAVLRTRKDLGWCTEVDDALRRMEEALDDTTRPDGQDHLPPLPEPFERGKPWKYTADQMQAYARAAIKADRERRDAAARHGDHDPADIIAGALQCSRAYAYELMEAALSSRATGAVPAGYRLVPVEPTLAMTQAALDMSRKVRARERAPLPIGFELWAAEIVYAAMLASAPEAPAAAVTDSPCACWPGRMCSRSAECAKQLRDAAPTTGDSHE